MKYKVYATRFNPNSRVYEPMDHALGMGYI